MTTYKILSNETLVYTINEHEQIASLYEGEGTTVAQWVTLAQVRNIIDACKLWYQNVTIQICQTQLEIL